VSVNVVRIKVASHLAALNQPAISLEILKRQHALKHKVRDEIIAVEAHGGRLTGRYVEDHLFTMRAVLEARRAELEDRVPVARWSVEVVFVAHQIDAVYLIRCWFQTFPFGCHIEHFLISNRWLLSRASLT
ncbi:hypothetical protein, partial [Paracoccus haematequi]|uniref:hypothetical protein n=1 Tax=Paracoccus haematequi TaxID=2491866 RepID=UPI0013DF2A43